jgi:FlaG/FlaF family flagellin (archaellin)
MQVTLGRRRGVSPIVAEVTLIAVLLIATIMLASFTFGVFSFYYSPAEVAADGASCSSGGNSTTCQLTLTNMGAKDTSTTGSCSLDEGTDVTGYVTDGGVVPAGGSLTNVHCVALGVILHSGSLVEGALSLTNGGTAFFFGSVQ